MEVFSVQAHEFKKYPQLLDQMFRTRKKVFSDDLGWDVTINGEYEQDLYDDMCPVYLIWSDSRRIRHYGSMRLMPTTGPTLLYDVFRNTFPDAAVLSALGIWEGTRMCIDEIALASDHPSISPRRAFCLLLLALCEFGLEHGIETMVSNYEPHMKRLYQSAGAQVHEIGRANGYGRHPVCCGLFEVSEEVLSAMRQTLEVLEPIYEQCPKVDRAVKSNLLHLNDTFFAAALIS